MTTTAFGQVASLLLNPAVPKSGNVIKTNSMPGQGGGTGWKFKYSTHPTEPNQLTWWYWLSSSKRAVRDRTGFSVQVRLGTTSEYSVRPFIIGSYSHQIAFPDLQWYAWRHKAFINGVTQFTPLWSRDYVPCSEVHFYWGWMQLYAPSPNPTPNDYVPVKDGIRIRLEVVTTGTNGVVTQTSSQIVKANDWTPEQDSFQKIYTDPSPPAGEPGNSYWWKEVGYDITAGHVAHPPREPGSGANTYYARDAEDDPSYTWLMDDPNYDFVIARNPEPYQDSPFNLDRNIGAGTIIWSIGSACPPDCNLVGKVYQIKMKYDKFKCFATEANMSLFGLPYDYQPDGNGEQTFTYTVPQNYTPHSDNTAGAFEWNLAVGEARKVTDFMVTSIT